MQNQDIKTIQFICEMAKHGGKIPDNVVFTALNTQN